MRFFRISFLLVLSLLMKSVLAQAPQANAPLQINPQGSPKSAWLGVMLAPLPEMLRSHLSEFIRADEGLLVTRVEMDSPATRAGIRRDDVLLSFARQRLYTPAQLASLVRHSEPGTPVEMELVQQGQRNTLNVVPVAREMHPPGARPVPMPPRYSPRSMPRADAWESFKSIRIETIGTGRYRASVAYRDDQGQLRSFNFEGSRQEIIEAIRKSTDLPQDRKRDLLQALDMGSPRFGHIEEMFDHLLAPYGPLLQPLFEDPFYQDPFLRDRSLDPRWSRPRGYPPAAPQRPGPKYPWRRDESGPWPY